MEEEKGGGTSAGGRRRCGYHYMMPSYVALDEEDDAEDSYLVVADALLENSSAHGLPTFYRARGLKLFCCEFYVSITYTRCYCRSL